MKKIIFIILFTLSFFITNAQKIDYATNQIILKFKELPSEKLALIIKNNKFNSNKIDVLNAKYNLSKINATGNKTEAKTFVLTYNININVNEVIKAYKKTNLFEYLEPNYIGVSHGKKGTEMSTFPNDNLFFRQWSLFNDGTFTNQTSTPDADIDMELAWDLEVGSPDIIVAVLDSGTRIGHPEFNNRIWVNPNENSNGMDSDNNGYIDDINGWDFESQTNNLIDGNGHGSNVAGIIGLNANNNIGYAGVDWHCKLMTCRVLDNDGFGLYTWWAEAIYYAVANGAHVINMSLGGNGYSQILKDAVDFAYDNNVAVVVSSGNQNVNGIQYPSRFENAIAVGSTDANDHRSSPFFWDSNSGSNYGINLDIVAPGGLIYGINNVSDTNYYRYWGGTSQAAPHVTGVISLLLAQNPNLTPLQLKNILQDTADDQVGPANEDTNGFDIFFGHGRLNAYNAILNATAGINDNNNLDFTIYPNPTNNGVFYIKNLKDTFQLKIYNTIGMEVYTENNIENNTLINVLGLKSGLYILQLKNKTNSISKKLIIR